MIKLLPKIKPLDLLWRLEHRGPAHDIFRFPLLKLQESYKLLHEINVDRAKTKPEAPNSMNRYGLNLGKRWDVWLDRLVEFYIQPIAVAHYKVRELKKHYAFIVDYDVKKQRSLATHEDSSLVTLNVCLGGSFTGGDLVFPSNGFGLTQLAHKIGTAIVHLGAREHRATPITFGQRSNLIVWCE